MLLVMNVLLRLWKVEEVRLLLLISINRSQIARALLLSNVAIDSGSVSNW